MIQHQWMLVANQFTNKRVICFLVLECCYVIRLVGIKQIPSFLLSFNRPKRFFFLPWEGWGVWILLGWGEEFESELSSLSSKIDFFFLTWRCFKVWSFQKCKCSRGCQWEWEGFWNFKLTEVLLRTSKRRLSWYKFQRGAWVQQEMIKHQFQTFFWTSWQNYWITNYFGFSKKLFVNPAFQSGFLIGF